MIPSPNPTLIAKPQFQPRCSPLHHSVGGFCNPLRDALDGLRLDLPFYVRARVNFVIESGFKEGEDEQQTLPNDGDDGDDEKPSGSCERE